MYPSTARERDLFMNFSACCSVSSSVAPSSGGVKPVCVEYFSHLRESFFRVFVREEKKRRKEPTEREREWRGFSLYCLLFLKNAKKTTTRRMNDEHRRYFYFSLPFPRDVLRVRAGAFLFTQKQRAIGFFFPLYPKRDRDAFFSKSRARKSRRERERERIERVRETRTRATHRKETTASMGPLRSPLKSPCCVSFLSYI